MKLRNLILLLIVSASVFTSCCPKVRTGTATFTYRDTIHDTIRIPGSTFNLNYDCEAFKSKYDSLSRIHSLLIDSLGFVELFSDSNHTVKAKKESNGSTTLKVIDKPKEILYSKPIEKIITAPCNCPPCPEPPKPAWYARIWLKVQPYLAVWGILSFILIAFALSPRLK